MSNDCVVQCLDAVGRPLKDVIAEFERSGHQYVLTFTRPPRTTFALEENSFYVLHQRIDESEVYHLIAAAKMAKEG
ncbi:hypothetical protein [Anaerospora sp.]|uniref:hypothetical protein n=1 Tax=Anaerospora sp. TaxID=1960278 RepID=UPI0028963C62|nr:hypothetical protein [Anaerospora sp.]